MASCRSWPVRNWIGGWRRDERTSAGHFSRGARDLLLFLHHTIVIAAAFLGVEFFWRVAAHRGITELQFFAFEPDDAGGLGAHALGTFRDFHLQGGGVLFGIHLVLHYEAALVALKRDGLLRDDDRGL